MASERPKERARGSIKVQAVESRWRALYGPHLSLRVSVGHRDQLRQPVAGELLLGLCVRLGRIAQHLDSTLLLDDC